MKNPTTLLVYLFPLLAPTLAFAHARPHPHPRAQPVEGAHADLANVQYLKRQEPVRNETLSFDPTITSSASSTSSAASTKPTPDLDDTLSSIVSGLLGDGDDSGPTSTSDIVEVLPTTSSVASNSTGDESPSPVLPLPTETPSDSIQPPASSIEQDPAPSTTSVTPSDDPVFPIPIPTTFTSGLTTALNTPSITIQPPIPTFSSFDDPTTTDSSIEEEPSPTTTQKSDIDDVTTSRRPTSETDSATFISEVASSTVEDESKTSTPTSTPEPDTTTSLEDQETTPTPTATSTGLDDILSDILSSATSVAASLTSDVGDVVTSAVDSVTSTLPEPTDLPSPSDIPLPANTTDILSSTPEPTPEPTPDSTTETSVEATPDPTTISEVPSTDSPTTISEVPSTDSPTPVPETTTATDTPVATPPPEVITSSATDTPGVTDPAPGVTTSTDVAPVQSTTQVPPTQTTTDVPPLPPPAVNETSVALTSDIVAPSTTLPAGSAPETTSLPIETVPPSATDGTLPTATDIAPTSSVVSGTEGPVTTDAPSATISTTALPDTTSFWAGTGIVTQSIWPSTVDESGPLPTESLGVPEAITPPGGVPETPQNSTLVQIGFTKELNYPFVSDSLEAAAQIVKYLPMGLSGGLNVPLDGVTMHSLQPMQAENVSYVITLGLVYIPSDVYKKLAVDIHIPQTPLYRNPDTTVKDLMNFVDPSIPLLPGGNVALLAPGGETTSGEGTGSGNDDTPTWIGNADNIIGDTGDTSSGGSDENAADPYGSDGSRNPVTTKQVTIGVASVGAAALYGVAMYFLAKRYRNNRLSHRRSLSLPGGGIEPPMSDMRSSGQLSPMMSAHFFTNGRTTPLGSDKRGSKGSKTSARGQISAPMMSENSLGWD